MNNLNTSAIITACEVITRHSTIGGWHRGSSWLFDKVMRAFQSPAVEAVTYKVSLDAPVMSAGEATIHRDGTYEIRRAT